MKAICWIATGLAGVVLLISIALAASAFWCMQAPAIPYASMEKMHLGMSDDHVRQLLGDPSSVFPDPDGRERWVYSRFTWSMYKIDFDANGTVVRLEHDF